jgi:hypothetical protein
MISDLFFIVIVSVISDIIIIINSSHDYHLLGDNAVWLL